MNISTMNDYDLFQTLSMIDGVHDIEVWKTTVRNLPKDKFKGFVKHARNTKRTTMGKDRCAFYDKELRRRNAEDSRRDAEDSHNSAATATMAVAPALVRRRVSSKSNSTSRGRLTSVMDGMGSRPTRRSGVSNGLGITSTGASKTKARREARAPKARREPTPPKARRKPTPPKARREPTHAVMRRKKNPPKAQKGPLKEALATTPTPLAAALIVRNALSNKAIPLQELREFLQVLDEVNELKEALKTKNPASK